jgi:alcohol dehydrogenase (cytochrome c)
MPRWTLLLPLLATSVFAASGDDTFENRCSVCHGADASGGGRAPSILGFVRYHTDAEISGVITNGRVDKGMPAFPIPAAVMPAMIAHLRELAGSNPAMGAAGLTGEGLKQSSGRKPGAGPKQGKLQLADNRVLEGLIDSEDDF